MRDRASTSLDLAISRTRAGGIRLFYINVCVDGEVRFLYRLHHSKHAATIECSGPLVRDVWLNRVSSLRRRKRYLYLLWRRSWQENSTNIVEITIMLRSQLIGHGCSLDMLMALKSIESLRNLYNIMENSISGSNLS